MAVGGRKNCISINIVGGNGSLAENLRENNYIFTLIDYFARYAIAIFFPINHFLKIISVVLLI